MKIVSLENLEEVITSHKVGKKKIMIKNGDVPHITQFSQVRLTPGEIVEEHAHPDMYEIFLTQEGEAIMNINGKEYKVTPGVCLTVEPGEKHETKVTGDKNLVQLIIGVQV